MCVLKLVKIIIIGLKTNYKMWVFVSQKNKKKKWGFGITLIIMINFHFLPSIRFILPTFLSSPFS